MVKAGVVFGIGFLAAACGYHGIGAGDLFGTQRLAVVPFEEAQAIGLAPQMASELSYLLASSGIQLTSHPKQAQAILTGRLQLTTTPRAAHAGVQAYQLHAHIHAELTTPAGERLWETQLGVQEGFLPAQGPGAAQPLATETHRRAALRRLAEQAAFAVHEALTTAARLSHVRVNDRSLFLTWAVR